ncbi:unnamed protein product [Cylindrotheca closterium]|uniref:Uncharacterized protein n=1 Tax=Cylindrotheca closterium TaxID=2856 RepID=A0AAD2PX00_9STRA|nr:unnamed protein product [Cylindrotheca closterium]
MSSGNSPRRKKSSSSSRRHTSSYDDDPLTKQHQSGDPCGNGGGLIHQIGKLVEYLDNSCTSTVEGIRFPSDSTTILGDMDTVDLEQYELNTVTDTVGETTIGTNDIEPAYSYATGDDASTAGFSTSTRTSYTTATKSRSPSKTTTTTTTSPVKKGPVASFHMVGRMHAKVPQTNTSSSSPLKEKGTFDDSSIVTAPTDSFTSSKANDSSTALMGNLQHTTIEEEKDEVASADERKVAEAEALRQHQQQQQQQAARQAAIQKGRQQEAARQVAIQKAVQEASSPEDAAILQGLDLCRRIRQTHHQSSTPIQYEGQRSYEQERPQQQQQQQQQQFRGSSSSSSLDNQIVAANVPKTKMYGDRFSPVNAVTQHNKSSPTKSSAALPPPPAVPKHRSRSARVSQKLKGILPKGSKASF